MDFTGERFLPGCEGEMVYEHWHRYLLALDHVAGRRVLDVASGEGYGSALLASSAASVTGVDISEEAVAHARHQYANRSNLQYLRASCEYIPLPDASFDVIVSFETIEHIHGQSAFVSEIDRLLAPNGVLIISSPNRDEYSTRTGYVNEFHVKELDRSELNLMLAGSFPAMRWFAQKPCFHSLMWPLDGAAEACRLLSTTGGEMRLEALYYVVYAARKWQDLAALQPVLSLVADESHSVYAEWSRTYAENRSLQERVRALEERLEASERRQRSGASSLLGRLFGRWLG